MHYVLLTAGTAGVAIGALKLAEKYYPGADMQTVAIQTGAAIVSAVAIGLIVHVAVG